MKGKNKLVLVLFAVMALVVSSVVFALKGNVESVRYAKASSIEAFTTELEGGIIFSAERVYFAVDSEGKSNSSIRSSILSYGGYNFNSIETNNGTEYFADYGLNDGNGTDYSHKHIVGNGEFVMVDDNASYSATIKDDPATEDEYETGTVSIKQGIMITLGGYYYNEVTKQYELNGEGIGAGMDYVAAQATLNGQAIELPNARGYNNSSYQDFTWFIMPSETTEGHYEISVLYMVEGLVEPLRYDFDFYLLLQSSYEQEVEVESSEGTQKYTQTYTSKPTMGNATPITNTEYKFFSGTSLSYPTVTFDYARYELSYTHVSGDVTTTAKLDYDESSKTLTLSNKLYNDEEKEYYLIDHGSDNTIVTLMFVDNGKYDLHFDYIYKYQGEKITIPQEQIPFENISLNIYGYQLKFSKAGFASADMTYLEVYRNNTMFIIVNGFINADDETTGDSLGVQYKLINDVTQKTGTIKDADNIRSKLESESANIIRGVYAEDIDKMIENETIDAFVNSIKYQKTDRGLWLTLSGSNSEYYFQNDTAVESFYYYHPQSAITTEFIKGEVDSDGTTQEEPSITSNRKNFTKVTTFTAPGYYLIQVKYDCDLTAAFDIGSQWFAFQVTSTTPVLQLYKTESEVLAGSPEYDNFYAHEYTNQNVYATWAETEIFESTVVGKLYYANGKYASESELKKVANGTYSSAITKEDYNKYTLIKNSGSYLLVLEVERSATKTYTYFTIDKETISGLQIYEVVTNSIDNRAIYSIKQDSNLNYIDHTSSSVINTTFTLDWADKASGASIYATYKFTPFVKTNQDNAGNSITITQGSNVYKYVINEYAIGQTSKNIEIHKPTQLNSALDVNNVLTDQGIYEFYIKDVAGNELVYIVVVDNTEGVINATYGDEKSEYLSGQLVADYVELEWGTHKAINLGASVNSTITRLLNGEEINNYYNETGNNWFNLVNMFQTVSGNNLFVVQNLYTEIKLHPFDLYQDNYYVLTNNGAQQIKYPNGITSTGWDSIANKLFENATSMGIKINIDSDELHRYTFEVIGSNQVTTTTPTTFSVYITPDKAQGEVYSSSQEAEYNNSVLAHAETTKYFNNEVLDENVKLDNYAKGQASNDGVFVFEWLIPSDEDNFKVTEVKYNYYQLMDQTSLNNITANTLNNYPYYPYNYVSTNYILKTEEDVETISQYTKTTRVTKDSKGNVIENRSVNQSEPINLAYETYYQEKNNNGKIEYELVSKKVTQTGLYIITRTIEMKVDEGIEAQKGEFSYAFFVDRNMIVGYSITDVDQKIVGQFIHIAMPNSESKNGVKYDNFTKQGLKPQTQTYYENNESNTISYQVYLETNKLPTLLQVPSGKYVSGSASDMSILATSHLNLNLKLSVYFFDSYNILPNAYKGTFVKLMSNMTSNRHGYIDLSFSNIDNPGVLTEFRNSRMHNEDNSLSLPGIYVFIIEDTVSKKLNDQFEVYDTNQFIFGIKLINNAPQTDVYTYAEIDGKQSDKIYADGKELYTNQQFVDFVIPKEDLYSYEAQLDIASIEIWRSNEYGGSNLWLRLKQATGGYGFAVDTNGIIQNLDRIKFVEEGGKVVSYIIKLDTGLVVEQNQIVDYKEYVYTINIQYVLTNSATKYYTYKSTNEQGNTITNSFYSSIYTVTIDRTPNSDNLNALMAEQGNYFEGYHNWLAEQNEVQASNNVNENFAYRSTKTLSDYYGLANDLYYQFASTSGNLSNQAMYALNVSFKSTFNPSGLSEIYYRQIEFDSPVDANARMGLLPITNTYFETSEYYTFNESLTAYKSYSMKNKNDDYVKDDNIYYWAIMGLTKDANGSYETSYNNRCGIFYEIIEKDVAGNYTQYVIYFAPKDESEVSITLLSDKVIGNEEATSATLTFTNNAQTEQRSFIGIKSVQTIQGLVNKDVKASYYANINIYNASREKIKTIYTNSTSVHDVYDGDGNITIAGLESEVYEAIKEQGNYIIEYVNVFGNKYSVIVNNYTNDKHKLNTATLEVKTDSMTGQNYITFSGLNTKIDDNTYWYVNRVEITYNAGTKVVYVAGVPKNNITCLEFVEEDSNTGENEVTRHNVELDRLNLQKGIQYLVTIYDVGGNVYVIPLSTSADYYAYKLITPNNIYAQDNIIYTATQIQLSYNTDFYEPVVEVYLGSNTIPEVFNDDTYKNYYTNQIQDSNYKLLTLLPDSQTNPADCYGSLRRFVIKLMLNGEVSQSYEIYIDTRATNFAIENTNKVDKIDYIKSTLNNVGQDYNIMDLINSSFYEKLVTETVNISWTRLTSDYFTYNYQLFEFVTADEYVELLKGSSDNSYTISPKEDTTGKYILKVTIASKNGIWIATRVYGIFMSTTITGLYEVKDGTGNIYDYSSITNLDEIKQSIGGNVNAMATALGFASVVEMNNVFNSFGLKTAIPMYIANTELTLHSNQDNGVNSMVYTPTGSSYAQISFYRVYRSNYQTFAVIMKVYATDKNQNLLSTLSFFTTDTTYQSLLNNGTATTVYNANAKYYKLTFDSYNRNTGENLLERHNKIIIDIYYNNEFAKRVKGGDSAKTTIEFKNSGSYTLKIMDEAGNVQYFSNNTTTLDSFTVVVMKDMLYTVNSEAPIQYAYYDSAVTLQINRYNEATGRNNYDINTIRLSVIRNSEVYTGYEHPTESATYIFRDYGTYLITISAKLLGTDTEVSSQLVFTILNPNEARTALDFTSIYGYNIISVFSITATAEKDVTDKFIDLLQDKSNTGEINVYNKLITYERLVEAFGTSTQGKMKFRVLYEVENDDLLPARVAEFAFTLNNETATITSSIKAGGKTTKEVLLKFNAANIYDQIGDCSLVINGEVVLRIDENSSNSITEIRVTNVGKYYVQLMGDSGNIATSFNFTIKQPLNTVSIILIVVVSAIVVGLIGTFIWLRTRMKVR